MKSDIDRIDLPQDKIPSRWYNVLPDLPWLPEEYIDSSTNEVATQEYLDRLLPRSLAAQEFSLERWVRIPEPVLDSYKLWRPTPLFRFHALERHLDTPAEIWVKYEGAGPAGSHKLNSALAQAYYAKNEGIRRLVTDTGGGQWGSALALAGALMDIEVLAFMVRVSYEQKPYRRFLMETYDGKVHPSPGPFTEYGRKLLEERPDHPGSEATAGAEALEVVLGDETSRYAMGAFSNFVLLHQTVIGLEVKEQLASAGVDPDYLVASVGCGSNFGGFVLPWVSNKLEGSDIKFLAAEPSACPTLTRGEYKMDYSLARGVGPAARTMTLGHEFVPPPIHSGGLRYHGAAPLIGLLRHHGIIDAVAYPQNEVFAAGKLFAKQTGYLPAPESAHAIRAAIDLARQCKEENRRAAIVICCSGQGMLDLGGYGKFNAGELEESAPEGIQAPELVEAVRA